MNLTIRILTIYFCLTLLTIGAFTQNNSIYKINSDSLKKLDQELNNDIYGKISGIIVISDSKILFENYYRFNSKNSIHPISSVTKSVTSLITGICLDKGIISTIDTPIYAFFPEYEAIFEKDTLKKLITIRHLLNQTAGFEWDEWTKHYSYAGNALIDMCKAEKKWIEITLNLPIASKPGEKFAYNSGNSQIIKEILCNNSGKDFYWLVDNYLFKPLKIDHFHWDNYPINGYPAWGGVSTTTMDMAKLGMLICNNGKWNDTQLVPQKWIEESIKIQSSNGKADYGLHWWITKQPDNMPLIYAAGYGDQYVYVAPDKRIVIAINGQNFTDYKWPKSIDMLITTILSSLIKTNNYKS